MLHSAIANAQNKNEDVDVDQIYRFRSLRERRPAPEACAAGSDGPRLPDIRGARRTSWSKWRRKQAQARRHNEWVRKFILTVSGSALTSRGARAGSRSRDYAGLLQEDLELKEGLRKQLKSAGVSSIEVDRPGNKLRVTIRTSRPGIIIGRKGAEIEKLKTALAKKTKREVFIDIQEVHKPELDAQLVSESIALQLEKRVAFRRAMRKAVDSALRFGCKGIKVRVSGRLNGAEIARSEWYLQGQLPLHTLRADIDYGFTEAHTTYGVIGVKSLVVQG